MGMVFAAAMRTVMFIILITVSILSYVGGNNGNGDVKTTSEAVEANQVEANHVTRSAVPTLSCNDPSEMNLQKCPSNSNDKSVSCSDLPAYCLQCEFNCTCVYGQKMNITCKPKPKVVCHSDDDGNEIVKEMICRYCYQTEPWQHSCSGNSKCNSLDTPRPRYSANCTVAADVLCHGRRNFLKKKECNWTSGYSWSTALILSTTLGGFGADRFYLGHWQEGIGKLFSFGGLGVWTIMDVILIAIRYLGPADGSLYI